MKTVLLIEDDGHLRELLAQYLSQTGWQVFEAADGESGISLAKQHRPAAVVCDMLMPRGNGYQVCAALRKDPWLQSTKIIAVSGKGFPNNRLSALEAGAHEFLLKPVNPHDLVMLLSRVTGAETEAPFISLAHAGSSKSVAQVKFWGVRGSIPTPGPETVFYGGNTSCVEVRADGEIIILDAGTGIRMLGAQLADEFKDRPLKLTLLITHTHWDHIQGLPFFLPAYNSSTQLHVLGYEGARAGFASILNSQMEVPFFPIGLPDLPGKIVLEELKEMTFTIGKVKVRAAFMNHPGICVGYRLDTSNGSVAYLPDNEPYYRLRAQTDADKPNARESLEFASAEDQKLVDFIRGVDVLIIDTQYTADEYNTHKGWGHGCLDDVVALALRAQVKQLFTFHHDPGHDDEAVSRMVEDARQMVTSRNAALLVDAAREGQQFSLTPVSDKQA